MKSHLRTLAEFELTCKGVGITLAIRATRNIQLLAQAVAVRAQVELNSTYTRVELEPNFADVRTRVRLEFGGVKLGPNSS